MTRRFCFYTIPPGFLFQFSAFYRYIIQTKKKQVIIVPLHQEKIPISQEDNEFFQSFYEQNKNFLFYIANRYTSSPADCEDVVQDAVIRLMQNIPSIRGLDHCKAAKYIALTVRSAYLDLRKKRHKQQEISLEESVLDALLEKESLLTDNSTDLRMELILLKESLSPREWILLEGKYILGYDQEELSELIGVTPDSIRMTLSRARTKARKILLPESGKDGATDV